MPCIIKIGENPLFDNSIVETKGSGSIDLISAINGKVYDGKMQKPVMKPAEIAACEDVAELFPAK